MAAEIDMTAIATTSAVNQGKLESRVLIANSEPIPRITVSDSMITGTGPKNCSELEWPDQSCHDAYGDDDADNPKDRRGELAYLRPCRGRVFCIADLQKSTERGVLPPAEPFRQPALKLAPADNRRTDKDSHYKKDQHIQPSNDPNAQQEGHSDDKRYQYAQDPWCPLTSGEDIVDAGVSIVESLFVWGIGRDNWCLGKSRR
jgi:hypothetical protein